MNKECKICGIELTKQEINILDGKHCSSCFKELKEKEYNGL